MGFLHRRRHQGRAIYLVVCAFMGVFRRRPQPLDDIDDLLETRLTLVPVDVVAHVLIAGATSPKAHVEAAPADQVQRRRILGESDGLVQGRNQDCRPQPNTLGAGCDAGGNDQGGGPDTVAGEVVLGEPGVLEAKLLAVLHLLRGLLDYPAGIGTLGPRHVCK